MRSRGSADARLSLTAPRGHVLQLVPSNEPLQKGCILAVDHPVAIDVCRVLKGMEEVFEVDLDLPPSTWSGLRYRYLGFDQGGHHRWAGSDGRYVVPRRLQAEGLAFRFPGLREALQDLLKR